MSENVLKLITHSGDEVSIKVRKVNVNHLAIIAAPAQDKDENAKAKLFIHPEGRSVDEVSRLFESLSEESQAELYFTGYEVNEENLNKYHERQKKFQKSSGISQEMQSSMMEKVLEKRLDAMLNDKEGSPKTAGTASSETVTPA